MRDLCLLPSQQCRGEWELRVPPLPPLVPHICSSIAGGHRPEVPSPSSTTQARDGAPQTPPPLPGPCCPQAALLQGCPQWLIGGLSSLLHFLCKDIGTQLTSSCPTSPQSPPPWIPLTSLQLPNSITSLLEIGQTWLQKWGQ